MTMNASVSLTLDLLEKRLARLHLTVHGDNDFEGQPQLADTVTPVAARIQALSNSLSKLQARSAPAAQILSLHNKLEANKPKYAIAGADLQLSRLDIPAMKDCVLAHKTTIHQSAARFSALDPTIPDTKYSLTLVNLLPRLEALAATSIAQADAVTELVRASASVVARWHQIGIVSSSECFAEWEARLMQLEKRLRRQRVELEKT